jgi:hypothetical protein
MSEKYLWLRKNLFTTYIYSENNIRLQIYYGLEIKFNQNYFLNIAKNIFIGTNRKI